MALSPAHVTFPSGKKVRRLEGSGTRNVFALKHSHMQPKVMASLTSGTVCNVATVSGNSEPDGIVVDVVNVRRRDTPLCRVLVDCLTTTVPVVIIIDLHDAMGTRADAQTASIRCATAHHWHKKFKCRTRGGIPVGVDVKKCNAVSLDVAARQQLRWYGVGK